jgi:hypothetical protein
MHYETGRFRSDRERKVLTKNCPLYITRAYRANGPVFMVLTRYCMTSVTNEIAFQSYGARRD